MPGRVNNVVSTTPIGKGIRMFRTVVTNRFFGGETPDVCERVRCQHQAADRFAAFQSDLDSRPSGFSGCRCNRYNRHDLSPALSTRHPITLQAKSENPEKSKKSVLLTYLTQGCFFAAANLSSRD
jgi:hypothetical protein